MASLRAPVVPKEEETLSGEEGSSLALHTKCPPILCTGFQGSVAAAASHLFDFGDPEKGRIGNSSPLLTENDKSTKVPGVFLVGPSFQHDALTFCFIYKFRQRFAVVANAICGGLGRNTQSAVDECRLHNMYLDNFVTCEDMCGDACAKPKKNEEEDPEEVVVEEIEEVVVEEHETWIKFEKQRVQSEVDYLVNQFELDNKKAREENNA